MGSKLTLKPSKIPAIEIHRKAIENEKLVYVVVMQKFIKYPDGKSRIAYIGTTKAGIHRIAASGAYRAKSLLTGYGQRSLKLHTITCSKRQGLSNSAKLLESALLAVFRREFGSVPKGNSQGKNIKKPSSLKWFSRERLEKVIEVYSNA